MSAADWTIRELLPEDAAAFRELRLRALRDHPFAFGTALEEELQRPVEATAQRFAAARAVGGFVLGGFRHGALVGTIGFLLSTRAKERHKGDIWGVYVAPEARRSGLARALLAETIARAREVPGLEQIHLTVASSSQAAKRLYLAAGFETYGIEPRALKVGDDYDDEELMVLRL